MQNSKIDFINGIKPLNCVEVLRSFQLYESLKKELEQEDGNELLIQAMAEYAVLGYFSIHENGKPVFDSPKALLQSLTIDELADFYDAYCHKFLDSSWEGE